jgi:molybdopterin-guanine dinucleotide biosynthesis protein A
MSVGAIVLCGGQSTRMGRPKAWLPFGPERMLQRVVRLLHGVAEIVIVVAAPGQDLPELPTDIAVVRDRIAGRGPLQGLAAGLSALPDRVALAYATSADVPFVTAGWITNLVELIGDNDLAIPQTGDHFHPLAALYRKSAALPAIESLLAENKLRAGSLMEAVKTRVVHEAELKAVDPTLGTLRNLNFPEDYEQALRDAGFGAV